MSVPSSVYLDDATGTLFANKAYLNTLQIIGNTAQSGVSSPYLLTPSIAAANTFVYTQAAANVYSFSPVFPVIQDAAGRARLNSDTLVVGNLTATNYLNYPAYTLPANIALNSLSAQLLTSNTTATLNTANISNLNTLSLQANSATVGLLTVGNLQGYTPPVANFYSITGNSATYNYLNANSLSYTFANASTLACNTANITTLFVGNLVGYSPPAANLSNISGSTLNYLTSNTGNLTAQSVMCNNIQIANQFQAPAQSVTSALGAQSFTTYPITLQSNVGAYSQICTVSDPQTAGTYNVKVALVQSRGYNAVMKTYNLPFTYNTLPLTWQRCVPEYNTGIANGNDFALDVISTGSSTVSLRVVRTAVGSNINPGLTAYVSVLSDVGYPVTVTPNTTTGLSANNSGLYLQAPFGVNQGNVCILTENPQYPFDVNASMRVGGSLTANSIICSNIQGLSAQANTQNLTGSSLNYINANLATLISNVSNIATLYCSNIVGYTPPVANVQNLAGSSLNYLTANVGTLTSSNETTGNLVCSNCKVNTQLTAPTAAISTFTGNPVFGTSQVWQQANAPGFYIGNALSTNQSGFLTFNNAGPPSGPGALGLGVFGVGGLTVSGTGNVGIQQSQPAYLLDVGGTGRVPTLLSSNVATSAVNIPGNNPLNFAYDNTTKDPNAGVIGYQRFSGTCLDIIGAGTGPPNRAVRVWETLGVGMNPSYPLDISGTGRIPTLLNGGGTISASNPYISVAGGGDLIGLKFSAAADRYGLALNGGVTRVITSGVNATAQVGLSLASTDGPGASATGFTDLLYASNSGVTVTRPFTAQTANVSTLFCSNIVGYSPTQAANLTNITGNSANYAQITTGNLIVQSGSTDVSGINPDAYNPLMVYEDCTRSTLAQGYLSGSASYTAGNGYVTLTQAATGLNGFLNYPINPGTAFDVTAELFVGTAGNSTYPADGFSFYCYNNGAAPVDLYQNTVAQGYVLGFSDYASANAARGSTTPAYSVMLWYNGTLLASQSYTAYSVPLNTWTQLRISFIRNVWRVWLGTTQVINFQDVSRTLVGTGTQLMGFGGQTGGYWASHLIRNIQISKHAQGPWRPASGGNVVGISYNGTVTAAGPLNTTGNLSTSQHAYVAGNAYITGPIVQNLGQDPGEFIYSRYTGGIGDRYGIGQWPGGKTRVFSSATYAPGFAALSIASTDTIGPSGSNFQDIVVASNSAVTINRPLTVSGNPTFSTNQLYQQGTTPGFYIGSGFSTGNCGFMTFNNAGPPSGPGTLGLGVFGQSPGGGLSVANTGYVGINYSTPAYPLDVGGQARVSGALNLGSAIAMPANNIGDWMNTNYTPNLGNPSDRYGIGQYNAGYMRLFGSSYFTGATVNLSLASADSTGGGGTFTDLLTASNTAIVMRRPVTVNAVANTTHFLQGTGYQNLFVGNTQSTGGCGFLTFNNPTSPGYSNSLGIGVYGAPGGITLSPNGSVGISQTQPSASVSLDIYGPCRAQMSYFSQTFWNAGGTYSISSSNYNLVNNTSIFTALYTGNNQATDVSANSLWGSGATYFTIPINGIYNLSIDGTLSATSTVGTQWSFAKIGGSTLNGTYTAGQSTCTNNLNIHSTVTLALIAGDQPYATFISGSTGSFSSKNLSLRITLLQRT